MDSRCPRKLKKYPCKTCPLAVERLKALAKQTKNTANLKDDELPGCNWFVSDQESYYCFFLYIFQNEKSHNPIEIAQLLAINQPSVYASINHALRKIRDTQTGKLLENYKKKNDSKPTDSKPTDSK